MFKAQRERVRGIHALNWLPSSRWECVQAVAQGKTVRKLFGI